ncbi:MAG: ABC transporter ATP-binding protein, partial [Candidatus Pacebacteria bacterium CG10_big_fil_rev_8_21_14_0_10_56_10]
MRKRTSPRPDVAIQLTNVTKTYQLRQEKPTFVEQVMCRFQSSRFTALDNVNLTIYKGEKIGIVGPNGSGKTTLLKIIAGITTPDRGRVITNGKVVSLIDLTAGFHPELTGIENIRLNGLVIGVGEREVFDKLDDIVKFADIGQFIYQPLFTYSEGMKLRLGFSIAIHA